MCFPFQLSEGANLADKSRLRGGGGGGIRRRRHVSRWRKRHYVTRTHSVGDVSVQRRQHPARRLEINIRWSMSYPAHVGVSRGRVTWVCHVGMSRVVSRR